MADVARSRGALLTLFADNTSGDISAQDQRDFVVSTMFPQSLQGFRLTLESGVPVSTSDQTAKTTVYLTPYEHNCIGLYDGTSWEVLASAEVSLALGTLTSGLNYDVFAYNSSGTLTLELTAWTNDTTRATALVRQDGVWCKTGALTRRYVGTIRTTATTTTEDSARRRFVFNADNRVRRRLAQNDATASWTYGSTTWRQADGDATNQVEVVIGLAVVAVDVSLLVSCDTDSSDVPEWSIGADSTTTPSSNATITPYHSSGTDHHAYFIRELFSPAVGYHYYAWLERLSSGTTTLYGGKFSGLQGATDA